MIRVIVEPTLCHGYANCLAAAPGVFDLDEHDRAQPLLDAYPEDQRDVLERAVRRCPTGAISLGVPWTDGFGDRPLG